MKSVTFATIPQIIRWWNALSADVLLHPNFPAIPRASHTLMRRHLGLRHTLLDGLTLADLFAPLLTAHMVYSTPMHALQTVTLVSLYSREQVSVVKLPSHTFQLPWVALPPSCPFPSLWPEVECIKLRPAQHLLKTQWQIKLEWSVFTV